MRFFFLEVPDHHLFKLAFISPFSPLPFLTDAGHAGDVQAVAIETIAREAFWNAHTAAMGAAVQDTTLFGL